MGKNVDEVRFKEVSQYLSGLIDSLFSDVSLTA
jgi:hypothetical protein